MFTKRISTLLVASLAALSLQAYADPEGPMMGGGYGPGMMGGGYGHGMMGGFGMGMMGGGCGGMGPMSRLDLNKEQRQKITAIYTDLRKQNWARMGQMMDAMEKMDELTDAARPNPKAVGKAFADISDIKRQMIEAAVEANNKARGVLTDEQRKELRQMRRGDQWGQGYRGHMMMDR